MKSIVLLLASVATVLSTPISLELSGGSVIRGDLVSWNGPESPYHVFAARRYTGRMSFLVPGRQARRWTRVTSSGRRADAEKIASRLG